MHIKQSHDELIRRISNLEKQLAEHKQVVEELNKYKFIVDAADEFMTLIDRNYVYEAANKAYFDAGGKKRSEIIGRTVEEVWGRKKLDNVINDFLGDCFTGKESYSEDWFKFNERILKCYAINYYPYRNKTNDVTHAVVISHDITEHKLAEKKLRESESLLRKTFEAVPDVMTVHDKDFHIILSNWKKRESIYEKEGENRPHCYEVYMNRGKPCESCPASKVFDTGKPGRFEHTDKKNGKSYEINIYPVFDESENVTMILEHINDITERKKTEKEKRKLEARLQQAQKIESIGTLAGGIAHDFNNILTSIIGYTEIVMDDLDEGSLTKRNLTEILTASNRAKDLVKQILTFSCQTEQNLKPVQIGQVVVEVLRLLRASIPTTIKINQKIDDKPMTVLADSTMIHQVLMNLCTNSLHAMDDDGGTLDISLDPVFLDTDYTSKFHNLNPGNYLRLTVEDTGHGMTAEIKERIFEPYFTTKEHDKGTGLGLSVVHGIIKNHDGHITVDSEAGRGSKFQIYLPLLKTAVIKKVKEDSEPVTGGNENILCVDDEEQIIRMQHQMLERLGYSVTSRISSYEALEAFKADPNKFDLVITDMTMPNITGDKLAIEIKKTRPDIPIILCTGFSESISEERASEIGINHLLMKPVGKDDFVKIIRRELTKSGNSTR